MYCVPFYRKLEKTSSGNTIQKVVLFLGKGGTAPLDGFQPHDIQGFCTENGFVVKQQLQNDSTIFLEVDPAKTDISSFYTFEEAYKTMNECWRTFILILSPEQTDSWNVNLYFDSTTFSNLLQTISTLPV
jgi:hypothetical protein